MFGKGQKIRLFQKAAPTPDRVPNPKNCFPVFSTNSKVLDGSADKTGTLIVVEVSFE